MISSIQSRSWSRKLLRKYRPESIALKWTHSNETIAILNAAALPSVGANEEIDKRDGFFLCFKWWPIKNERKISAQRPVRRHGPAGTANGPRRRLGPAPGPRPGTQRRRLPGRLPVFQFVTENNWGTRKDRKKKKPHNNRRVEPLTPPPPFKCYTELNFCYEWRPPHLISVPLGLVVCLFVFWFVFCFFVFVRCPDLC